ncbi:hypothetical protein EDF42_1711 [Curtobacterium sp. PhB172]|uniref:hypothetical protein n=1 Tax=Curtobacterium sp. PhB172 TaxID=2485196 RepID=UPI000F4D1A29|nr:hypothetical protein [Curtobacterium sp. PhB172]ROS65289.1 hypothetical protein EDF42_1711 [Curtobacterium sp. PhB172]
MSPRRGFRTLGSVFSRRTLVWVAVIVVVLVVVDVVLVALALARTAPSSNGSPGPVPTFSSSPRSPGTRTAEPSGTATADPAGMVAPGRRLLSAVDGQEAWRASSGVCDGTDGVLEHTVDGGTTWTPVGLGAGAGAVLALRAGTDSISVVIGTGDDCEPTVRTSVDDGQSWNDGAAGAAGAGVGPDGLILSTGAVDSPCTDPIEAYEGEFTTAVVCADAVQWRSGDGEWVGVPLAGVRSLADDGDSYLVASVDADACAGVEIRSLPAVGVMTATKSTVVGCASEADPDGALAVARAGNAVWLWSGSDALVSTDDGVTW